MKRLSIQTVGGLSGLAGSSSPCLDCPASPCCNYLPLRLFQADSRNSLEKLAGLLDFDGIELRLSPFGYWRIFYKQACRFLDAADAGCTLYGKPERPQACKNYSAWKCWYKHAFAARTTPENMTIDRRRLDFIMARAEYDKAGKITVFPDWEMLQKEFVFQEEPAIAAQKSRQTFLVFPAESPPDHFFDLDHYRFCLGFPGIELAIIARDAWALLVSTRFNSAPGNNRAISGAMTASPKAESAVLKKFKGDELFSTFIPSTALRLRLEHFDRLMACFDFAGDGRITHFPSLESLRDSVITHGQ